MAADGELLPGRVAEVRRHLAICPLCHDRQEELLGAGAAFDEIYFSQPSLRLSRRPERRPHPAFAAAALVLVAFGALLVTARTARQAAIAAPEPSLTPGHARPVSVAALCAIPDVDGDYTIEPSVAQKVFENYGIRDPQPGAYEVDYLISPALGGSDDIRNLWPQPYSTGEWNARVKDALEDRLREMVCDGRVDLSIAQRDIASDWVAAYKKYFRTEKPLVGHFSYKKDPAWE